MPHAPRLTRAPQPAVSVSPGRPAPLLARPLPPFSAEALLRMQRESGNRSVGRLIRREARPAAAAARTFAQAWSEFDRLRFTTRGDEPLPAAREAVSLMGNDDAVAHAQDLASWLMDAGEWPLAQEALAKLERAWRARYRPQSIFGLPGNFLTGEIPALIRRAQEEARAGRHTPAFRLFGMAFLFAQMHFHQASIRREERLAGYAEELPRGGPVGVGLLGAVTRPLVYAELSSLIGMMRDIVGFYPSLEREAAAAGDADRAARLSGLGLLLRTELRDQYTLPDTRGIVMESTQTTTPRGVGYRLHGERGNEEIVTPLPGTRTPQEIGFFPSHTLTMEDLLESLYGQETLLTELLARPEIRREFGRERINFNSLGHRLRVWRTMYRVYQREDVAGFGALGSLVRLMERYLRHFTLHTEYNIRDFGVSYLSSDFPEDLAGRAARDCGVYALMTAYEVYRTAREATPRLPVDFELWSMPEHVALVIYDRSQGTFYVANNDRIDGPRRGEVIDEVARTYSGTVQRGYTVAPAVPVRMGSTAMADAAFRSQAWQRLQASAQWGLAVEQGQDRHQVYQRYYEQMRLFHAGSVQLGGRLDALSRAVAAATADTRAGVLAREVGDLVRARGLGLELARTFAAYGPTARINAESAEIRALLPQRPSFVFSQAANHPLARLGMALSLLGSLGVRPTDEQRDTLAFLRTVRSFADAILQYEAAGRPSTF